MKPLFFYKIAKSVSEKQRKLFGVALAMKRGKTPKTDTPAGEIAEELTEEQIRDYAKKPLKKVKKEKKKKKAQVDNEY
ncbi:MAG: hypothetical protein ABIM30_00590 [candidate division WOR-3 bacterium]